MSPVLELDSLSVAFRVGGRLVEAVREVSLQVAAGETVAIVGESGSGKSTTASAINRLLAENAQITAGRVLLDGEDLTALPESRLQMLRGASIGLVPQDPMSNLNPVLRVGRQVAEALEVHGLATSAQAQARAVELLEAVGISDAARRARQYPHEFSGGMRQRVLLAIGLACRPRLLIADEPTSALDVTVQRLVLDQLQQLTGELGTAVVLITHDLAVAAERADRIAVMLRGEIVETGPARTVLDRPQHEYTRRLIAAVPGLQAEPPARPPVDRDRPLLEVSGLRKVFRVRSGHGIGREDFTAVAGVSFQVPRHATVSIVGESGSGKSTVANLVLGLESPTAGEIRFDGQPYPTGRAALKAFRRRVQPVFQNPYASLDPRCTVARSVAEPLQVHQVGDARSRRQRVLELLDQVSLAAEVADRYPHELSGGQRQRVAIARALALGPELVVLDEAVSALDVLVQQQILELLSRLQRDLGLSYLFIGHDLAVVRMISDEVHVMRRGEVVESGPPGQIFAHPQHEYTQTLLAAVPGAQAAS